MAINKDGTRRVNMKDSIYTIPISEVFEPKCGCPICMIRDTLEQRSVEYIMGAAMMEPDVRIETNQKGFCKHHFDQMMKRNNRLSLALMLESHLKEIQEHTLQKSACVGNSGGFFKKREVEKPKKTCFICEQIDWALERMFDTVIKMYMQNGEFRALYQQQEKLCFVHFQELVCYANAKMDKKTLPEFIQVSTDLCRKSLDEIAHDVSHYCKMFDYRNSGADADWGNARDSIERAIYFLTSRPYESN